MFLLKGMLLGTGLFALGTILFLLLALIRPISSGVATGLSIIAALTTSKPFVVGSAHRFVGHRLHRRGKLADVCEG